MKKIFNREIRLVAEKGKTGLFAQTYMVENSLNPENKIILGYGLDKICRFCKKDATQTKFKNDAHIMPEFMGNKYAFSYFECDNCNKYFGTLEDSLSNYAGILNSFSSVKGKKGYAKFKGDKENIEVFAKSTSELIVRSSKTDKSETFIHDKENKKIIVDVPQPSYIPQDAFKALVKIGICLLPEKELLNYEKTINWLMKPSSYEYAFHFMFNVFRKVGGGKFTEPIAVLCKKKNHEELNNVPHHTLVIFYGIIQYQIFLPFNKNDNHLSKSKEIIFPLEENLIIDDIEEGETVGISIDKVYMGGIKRVVGKRTQFSTGFRVKE